MKTTQIQYDHERIRDAALYHYWRSTKKVLPRSGSSSVIEHDGKAYVVVRSDSEILRIYRVYGMCDPRPMEKWPVAMLEVALRRTGPSELLQSPVDAEFPAK